MTSGIADAGSNWTSARKEAFFRGSDDESCYKHDWKNDKREEKRGERESADSKEMRKAMRMIIACIAATFSYGSIRIK